MSSKQYGTGKKNRQHRSMEQNGKPRNPSVTKEATIYNGEKTVSSTNGARKLDSHMQKNETGPLSYTNNKNKLKMG